MYAQPVLDDNTAPDSSWPGPVSRLTAPDDRSAATGGRIPRQRCYRSRTSSLRQRCYRSEDVRLRDATVNDPRLRYPHGYTCADIALALTAAED
jgi:hypothetical protein